MGQPRGFHADAIERQIQHVERDKVRSAYNSWKFWPERVKLLRSDSQRCRPVNAERNIAFFVSESAARLRGVDSTHAISVIFFGTNFR